MAGKSVSVKIEWIGADVLHKLVGFRLGLLSATVNKHYNEVH